MTAIGVIQRAPPAVARAAAPAGELKEDYPARPDFFGTGFVALS